MYLYYISSSTEYTLAGSNTKNYEDRINITLILK